MNARNLTEWRSTWQDKALAKKKKFERVVGFFWFCSRMNSMKENPTATMGRVIAKQVPTDYFSAGSTRNRRTSSSWMNTESDLTMRRSAACASGR